MPLPSWARLFHWPGLFHWLGLDCTHFCGCGRFHEHADVPEGIVKHRSANLGSCELVCFHFSFPLCFDKTLFSLLTLHPGLHRLCTAGGNGFVQFFTILFKEPVDAGKFLDAINVSGPRFLPARKNLPRLD
jgi:hypothetical protein